MQENNLINGVVDIINRNDIVTYADLIEFFAYDCELYEPDDLVYGIDGIGALEPTTKHILSTDYDDLYSCAIVERDFFIVYLEQRKENIKEIEKDNLKEDILDIIENYDIASLNELKDCIINNGNNESDDDGGIDIATTRKYATNLLMYVNENIEFFKTYITIKNNI